MTDAIFAALLAVAALLVSFGAAEFHDGAGLAVGGVLLAAWSWLVLGDDDEPGDSDS
jgi:hypothetical protein